jgi:two-component system, chemotaxis family, CheB/CheR fusion protein
MVSKKKEPKSRKHSTLFPVVAVGASAGGLEAVSELFTYLSNNTGMAFVYIQHLDPTHKSLLPEIIGRITKMKVQDAKHLMPVQPNNIYIIPYNKDLYIFDGVLKLNSRQPKPAINLPIDKFFKSLAEVHKELAIGIVLSGNASDGTYGLKEIKNAGGLTFAQDSSAKFESMPKSAIAEGCVDMVLSPKEMAVELGRISKNAQVITQALQEDTDQAVSDIRDEDLTAIIELLRKSTGVDFQHYKRNTIKRRIIRRVLLYRLTTLAEYFNYLKQHTNEIHVLFQDLLINVTEFFRDVDTLEFLKKTILPKIIKTKTIHDTIRIWVPACSSGEEAYSIAIILAEILSSKGITIPVQIFASDLSENAIAKARIGLYSRNDVVNVSPKRLRRFFTKIDGSFRINKIIRDTCVFAPHNVFSDPPFSRLDLVSCCNLMIYLDAVLQKKVLGTFHYSLAPDGYLILGKSETLGNSGTLFSQVEKKYKVFKKKNEATNKVRFERQYRLPESNRKGVARSVTDNINQIKNLDFEKTAEEVLLSKYVPPSVLVNKDLDILQLHGQVNSFIQVTPGKATLNLLKLVRPELIFDLRSTIHKATKSNQTEKKAGLELKGDDTGMTVTLEVVPLKEQSEEKLFLIVFQKALQQSSEEMRKSSFSKDQTVKKLQKELEATKDDMRSILEEQEASNEELQSANEEIVSSNEELQSINEELETSKEEVESSNEELMTINNELQVRNEQLAEAHEYSEAVSETIREAVLILDKDFRVRSANKAFYRIFKTKKEETEGMLIYELGNRQWDILELRQLLEELIAKRTPIVGFEVQHNFPSIGQKTMLLHGKTITQKILQKQLIILAIEDITEHRLAQQAAQQRELWFKNMANNAPSMIWMAGVDTNRNFFNNTWAEFIGSSEGQNQNGLWKDFIHPEDFHQYMTQFESSFNSRELFSIEYRLKRHDGEYRWILDQAKPYYSAGQKFLGYIGTSTELHDKKLMMQELDKLVKARTKELKVTNNELHRSNNELQQFAYIASHDLQEPLRKILTYIDRIQNNKEKLSDTGNDFFKKIIESSRRMTRLIDDLLDFSSLSHAPKKFNKVDLNSILKDVLTDMEVLISDRKALVEYEENLPVIQGDQTQISQLFLNLISNAIKFSKENVTPAVRITSRMLSEEEIYQQQFFEKRGAYVELSFSDNGIGFNQEFADQIFVIFQRLHERKKYPGTGIGLALCKRIADNHGGKIFATSTNGGATFYVVLPLKQELMVKKE